MDVEFEKVEERVGYEVDCAIDLWSSGLGIEYWERLIRGKWCIGTFFDAKEKLEWPSSLITGWERNVL